MEVLWDGDGVPSRRDMGSVEVLWYGNGAPPRKDMGPVEALWDGDGVPPERTWDQWKYYGMEMGYPPPQKGHGTSESIMGWRWVHPIPLVNGQTPVKH